LFDYIKGTLARKAETYAVVDVAGIGYKIITTLKSLQETAKDDKVTFYTYLHVRDNVFEMYGFTTMRERSTFELLISVSGVGPKGAVNILSSITAEELALAIVTNDVKTITRAQGVGTKLAQRIILELKDKVKSKDFTSDSSISVLPQTNTENEAAEALIVLGYAPSEAVKAVKSVEQGLTLEETIKQALKNLL
jgi:Holliday junction DNA helicase RuvA